MKFLRKLAMLAAFGALTLTSAGCTTALVLVHIHDKLTEGDPPPCWKVNSVERALSARCGAFVPGSIAAKDVSNSGLPLCPLATAARDPRFWPVLPELIDKGALPESCVQSPLVTLAQRDACPDFASASPEVLRSFEWLAQADVRSVHHDAVRMLSCPRARAAGLDAVLQAWQAQGLLAAGLLAFSPIGALHPDYLQSPLVRSLEAQGHTARMALGAYEGKLAPGFEEAFRTGHLAALDWWLSRAPELLNRVPGRDIHQLPWIPLARVVSPGFQGEAAQRQALFDFFLARGADPWQRLPHDSQQTVAGYARQIGSPFLERLDPPPKAMEPSPMATARVSRDLQ